MTTHFSNGVTNVRGKSGGTSLFSSIKQPLITGGYEQEQAYQNDFVQYNVSDWETVTSTANPTQVFKSLTVVIAILVSNIHFLVSE